MTEDSHEKLFRRFSGTATEHSNTNHKGLLSVLEKINLYVTGPTFNKTLTFSISEILGDMVVGSGLRSDMPG